MTHLHLSTHRKPSVLSKRISLAGFSAVAAASMLFSTPSAEAGPAEIAAIQRQLTTIATGTVLTAPRTGQTLATPDQLAAAVKAAIEANAKLPAKRRLNPAVIAGEALKSFAALTNSNTTNGSAGAKIGAVVTQALFGTTTPTDAVLQNFVGDAAKAAATSRGANTAQVPSFVSALFGADANNTRTIAAAGRAVVGTAAGAVLAGRASALSDDLKDNVVTEALTANVRLLASINAIAKEVGKQVAPQNIGTFASDLANAQSARTLLIAPGVVAAQPEKAGDVTLALLAPTQNATVKSTIQKAITSYAALVGAVADIEQVSVVGSYLAREIGAGNVPDGVIKVGKRRVANPAINLAAGLARTLATSILVKPSLGSTASKFSGDNRADEIAEVAAFVVGGVLGNSSIKDNAALAKTTVLNIIKGAIAGSTSRAKPLRAIVAQVSAAKVIEDIVGSVALTIERATTGLSDTVKTELKTYLQSAQFRAAIAGRNATLNTAIQAAVTLGLSNSNEANTKLENGFVSEFNLANIVDPETDTRNF